MSTRFNCPPISDSMFPPETPLDLLREACKGTEAHPAAVGMQFLVALGNMVGRRLHTYVGETRHGTNENALIVGPTSGGRKGDAWHIAAVPFSRIDGSWFANAVGGGLSTGEGLIYSVRDPTIVEGKSGKEKVIEKGVADKRRLCIETEFSAVLKQFKRDTNILSNTVREAWDGKSPLGTLTKTSPTKATGAHISIIGHATPEDLRKYATDLDFANGVLNRFLPVASMRPRLVATPRRLSDKQRMRLVKTVNAIRNHVRTQREPVQRTEPATRLWEEKLYPALSVEQPGLLGALLARGPAHVTRLALLFSAIDCSPVVKMAHLRSAMAWWDYCVGSARVIFAGRTGDDVADRIRSEMLVGDEMTISEIRQNLFANKIAAGPLHDALDLLGQLGEVKIKKRRTAGRPAIVVRRVAPAVVEEVA